VHTLARTHHECSVKVRPVDASEHSLKHHKGWTKRSGGRMAKLLYFASTVFLRAPATMDKPRCRSMTAAGVRSIP
jgi:hypothetical protein